MIVYRSEYNGKIYETLEEYNQHIEFESNKFKRANMVKKLKDIPRLTATSIKDYEKKAFDMINKLIRDENLDNELLELTLSTHFGEVSTSHSAPIGEHSTWGKDNTQLGWYGTVRYVFRKSSNNIEHIYRNFPALNSGSGGYRGSRDSTTYRLEYSLSMYIKDFPIIQKHYDEYMILKEEHDIFQKNIRAKIDNVISIDEECVVYAKNIIEIDTIIRNLNNSKKLLNDSFSSKKNEIDTNIRENNQYKNNKRFKQLSNDFNK